MELIMAGVPESWVNRATADDLAVMQEVVQRKGKDDLILRGYSTAYGIGKAFGGGK